MTKKGIALSIVAVVLAVNYVIFFTDWFRRPTIEIIPQVRPGRASGIPRETYQRPVCPVLFMLDRPYRLTSIKVVVTDDLRTNRYPTPLWHVVSDSESPPLETFMYGERVKNMKPSRPRARPEYLQPDVKYTLLLEAGRVKGRTNFHTREFVASGR
jgi:hypothetical protein